MPWYRLKVRLPRDLQPPEEVTAEVNEENRWRVMTKDRGLRRRLVEYFRGVARLATSLDSGYLPDPGARYAIGLMRELPGTESVDWPEPEGTDEPGAVY